MSHKIDLMFKDDYVTVEITEKFSVAPNDAKCSLCNRVSSDGFRGFVPFDSIEVISIKKSRSPIGIDKDSNYGSVIVKEIKKLEKKVICDKCCGRFSLIARVLPGSYEIFE